MSLWPLYLIGAAFVFYTSYGITVYLWEESMRIAAEGYEEHPNNESDLNNV